MLSCFWTLAHAVPFGWNTFLIFCLSFRAQHRAGFLCFGTTDILGQLILCAGVVLYIVGLSAAPLASPH